MLRQLSLEELYTGVTRKYRVKRDCKTPGRYVCMYACTYVTEELNTDTARKVLLACMHACMHVCMHVCMTYTIVINAFNC